MDRPGPSAGEPPPAAPGANPTPGSGLLSPKPTEAPGAQPKPRTAEATAGGEAAPHRADASASPASVNTTAGQFQGAGVVNGDLYIHNASQARPAAAWEDELNPVSLIPEPSLPVSAEEVERQANALHDKRLMLFCHAPHLQDEAVAAMRAVLRRLQERHPERPVFASSLNGQLGLASLRRAVAWRDDRRGALIYLYRSTHLTTQKFFDEIEDVQGLVDQLHKMGAHLALTVKRPATSFRDESQLAGKIALWAFNDTRAFVASEVRPAQAVDGPFELSVALCAALFPGLGVAEFVELVNLLAPDPAAADAASPPVAAAEAEAGAVRGRAGRTPPQRSRHERWWRGERDAVLAELGVQLRLSSPSDGAEAESGGASVSEPGMYFEEARHRAEMPGWFYSRQPILLSERLDTFTRRYFSADASPRFRAGYRRLVLRLDALGAPRLTPDWLLQQFRASMQARPDYSVGRGLLELAAEAPETLHGEPLVGKLLDGLGRFIAEHEAALIGALDTSQSLHLEAENQRAPFHRDFWLQLMQLPAARPAIDHAALHQAIAIDIVLALVRRAPAGVAGTLSKTLDECDALHAGWVQAAGLADEPKPLCSLARAVFHDMHAHLLNTAPAAWLDVVGAVGEAHAGTVPSRPGSARRAHAAPSAEEQASEAASARRLALDFFYTLVPVFEQSGARRLPVALHVALLAGDAPRRAGGILARLLLLAAPPAWSEPGQGVDAAQAPADSVDIGSMIWLYKSMALAAMGHEENSPEQASATVAELIAPLRLALRPTQRMELVDVTRGAVDWVFNERDAASSQVGSREQAQRTRREYTRQIQAIQMVQRALRGAVQPGGSALPASKGAHP